jgi:hypothetical protein
VVALALFLIAMARHGLCERMTIKNLKLQGEGKMPLWD